MDSIVNPEERHYRIVAGSDPQLRVPSTEFNFQELVMPPDGRPDLLFITDAKSLAKHLRNVMVASRGIGVSAPQIGLNVRVIAAGSPDDPNNIIVAFNPRIIDEFGEVVKYEEGCLSFPGLFLRVKRKANIRVRYTTEAGVTDTIKLGGLTARIFQHEVDHLDGILFTDRVDNFELTRARNKQKSMLRRIKATQRAQAAMQAALKKAKIKTVPAMPESAANTADPTGLDK